MQCEYCDSILTAIPADLSCPHCGGRLKVAKPVPTPANRYCPKCGTPTQDNRCPKCDHAKLPEAVAESPVICPSCGSAQVATKKRGYSLLWALFGLWLCSNFNLTLMGLLFGLIGSGRTVCSCASCSNRWKI